MVIRFTGRLVAETVPYKLDAAKPDVAYRTVVGRFDDKS